MKITKKIFLVLLAVAVFVPCMLFSVSAEDTFNAEGIRDIEDIMEYYDLPDYLADNYENGTWNTEYYSGSNSSVVEDPLDPDNKVLKVEGKNNSYSSTSETDKLVVSFNLYIDETTKGEYKLDVKMKDANGVETTTFNTIFSANYNEGAFQYSVWEPTLNNNAGGFVLSDFEGITPEAGKWYKIVIFFNAAQGQYNFKISGDGEATWTYSDVYSLGNVKTMSRFELKTNFSGRTGKILIYLDEVEVYCGTFERSPSNKNNITAQTLLDLDALYNAEDTDLATKVRIANVFYQLIDGYKYVPADTTPELDAVKAVIAKTPEYINYAFANEFVSRVAQFDPTFTYYEKLAFIAGVEYYNEVLPEDSALAGTLGIDEALEAAVKAARVVYSSEIEKCEQIAADSDAFIKAMFAYDADSKNFDGYLKSFADTVAGYTMVDATYAEAVDGVTDFDMTDALASYGAFKAKYDKLYAAATSFISGASDMNTALEAMVASKPGEEAYENAFEVLYKGYLLADSVYNGGDIDENLDENTYAELAALFSVYLDNKDSVVAEIALCDQFNDIMKKAKIATYYTAIKEHLATAALIVDEVRTKYVGIEESKALYAALTKVTAENEDASSAYIAAVNEIAKEGFAEKSFIERKADVDAALSLKAEGDVLGIDGVKEANIILSKASAEIDALIGYSESLIHFVDELKATDSLSQRRALIKEAKVAAERSEPTYQGVADAKVELQSLIADFESDVNSANAAHVAATEKAAELAGAVAPDANVYKAASVIKDFVK